MSAAETDAAHVLDLPDLPAPAPAVSYSLAGDGPWWIAAHGNIGPKYYICDTRWFENEARALVGAANNDLQMTAALKTARDLLVIAADGYRQHYHDCMRLTGAIANLDHRIGLEDEANDWDAKERAARESIAQITALLNL